MIVVVGLGNPGNQYKDTRHNIGFLVVDELARRWNTPSWKRRYDAEVSEHRAIGPVLLVKPQTFMTERQLGPGSGEVLQNAIDRYRCHS